MSNSRTVFTILLNWNNAADTIGCLRSLRYLRGVRPEVIVIDNGSTDDGVTEIRSSAKRLGFPVTILETGSNLGFGGGCNVGIRHALERGADFVWLLNTDAIPHPDSLCALVEVMEWNAEVGAVGSVIYDLERPERIQTWGGGQVHLRLGITHHHCHPVSADRLHYLTACSLLLRSAALAQSGLFDEKAFFMYWEDADLCLRLRQHGWSLAVAERSLVWHRISSSLGRSHPLKDYYVTASVRYFQQLYAPLPLVGMSLGMTARIARRVATGRWRNVWAMVAALRGRPPPVAITPARGPNSTLPEKDILRIAVEASTLRGAKAGIGHYAATMSQLLASTPKVEVRYFTAREHAQRPPRPLGLLARQKPSWCQWVPMGRQVQYQLQRWQLAQLSRRWQPDLVFGPNFIVPPTSAPSVLVVHDLSHLRYPETHPPERVAFMTRHLRPAIGRSSAVIVDSHFTEQELLSRFPEAAGRLHVIYPGIASRMGVSPSVEADNALRAILNGDDRPYFLFLATLEPRKNLANLLPAYAALPDAIKKRHPLVLVGQMGWQQSDLATLLTPMIERGEVRMLGYLRDELLPAVYRRALALIYPSLYEGFGLPPVEAMAAGCPALVSNVSAMPEVCGDAALYCNPLDAASITEGMQRLADDDTLRAQLVAAGLVRAALYSWENAARQMLEVMREVARR
ncbi:glycosyltransferase [Acidithiobacillus caldus]|jgi:alpha-1,3-rhamnosyl/mannosyltransferase|uniref:glycosyltransferase n=1 Tax=Acidithiobacillus caldus TaxID=33059 RepID=UPI001C0787DB|nr:glycosyltransferase [Acidithiobacillus caldus]MBU2790608.1 glycosyltransferase [Acidithiobacillus caldus]MBU2822044.1 glycosyltransferase [Acidithiobacillus caldus]